MRQQLTKEFLEKAYVLEKKSTYQIAKECGTYANMIRRALMKAGIALRDKSEAQSTALESGRHRHPTKGRRRSLIVRVKISASMEKFWKAMSPEEKQRRVELSKEQWNSMTDEERESFQKAAIEAVRESARKGSKLELFVLQMLKSYGYDVHFHRDDVIKNHKMHFDLYLPKLRTVIEIDGPAHFYPIWGEENLAKHIASDNQKTGLVVSQGLTMIRVKNYTSHVSEIQRRRLIAVILDKLKTLEEAVLDTGCKLIEIEVK